MSTANDWGPSGSSRSHHHDRRSRPLLYARLWLAVRTWALLIPILARDENLERLLLRSAPGSGRPYAGISEATIRHLCKKAVRRPRLMTSRPCLREGLLLFRFLTMAGFAPELRFGIDPQSLQTTLVRAHCWVRLGDLVINPPEPGMVQIYAYPTPPQGAGLAQQAPVAQL